MNKEDITGPVNIGNPTEFTIKELAELVVDKGFSPSFSVFILFCFILFYLILFYFILFHFIFYFILYFIHSHSLPPKIPQKNPTHFISLFPPITTTTKKVKPTSTIKYLPLPRDDPKQRKPDITVAREQLKWTPQIPLQDVWIFFFFFFFFF